MGIILFLLFLVLVYHFSSFVLGIGHFISPPPTIILHSIWSSFLAGKPEINRVVVLPYIIRDILLFSQQVFVVVWPLDPFTSLPLLPVPGDDFRHKDVLCYVCITRRIPNENKCHLLLWLNKGCKQSPVCNLFTIEAKLIRRLHGEDIQSSNP